MSEPTPEAAPRSRRGLRIRVWTLSLLVLVAALAAWYWLTPWPRRVTALIQVVRHQETLFGERRTDEEDYRRYVKTQMALIKSRFVLNSAVKDSTVVGLRMIREQSDPGGWLEEHLEVRLVDGSEIVEIAMTTDSAGDATRIVNAVVQAYLREVVREAEDYQHRRYALLRELWEKYQEDIRKMRRNLAEVSEQLGPEGKSDADLDLADLRQKIEVREQSARQILEEAERMELDLKMPSRVRFVSSASTPGKPVSPLDRLLGK